MVKTEDISQNSASPAAKGLICGSDGRLRCFWVGHDALYQSYHDEEWGKPTRDERYLFEKLCLEGFQAGLSWRTILHKREAFRAALHNFDFRLLTMLNAAAETEKLLNNPDIVRHRGKIAAVFSNAKAFALLVAEYGSFAAYLYEFLPSAATEQGRQTCLKYYQTQTITPTSIALAKDLKKRGFRFIGPTSAYAYMQAVGLVNDHISGCFCHDLVQKQQKTFKPPDREFLKSR